MANSLRIGDSVSVRTPAAPATRYPTDSGTRLLGPSRTTITRAAPCGATHKEQLMAFPKHPIIDVTPVDAARGAAATAQAAAEPFMPPSFGKRVGKVDNQPLHTTFVDGRGNPVRNQGDAAAAASRLTGAAQTVAGAAVMAVGVPMLILPGPGVLAIGAGAAIARRRHQKDPQREIAQGRRVSPLLSLSSHQPSTNPIAPHIALCDARAVLSLSPKSFSISSVRAVVLRQSEHSASRFPPYELNAPPFGSIATQQLHRLERTGHSLPLPACRANLRSTASQREGNARAFPIATRCRRRTIPF